MDALRFIIVALAVYRVARMAAKERGPLDVFGRWQQFVFDRVQKPYNQRGGDGLHWFYDGVTCPACLSFWLGLIGALFLPVSGVEWYVLTALALSGAATFLYKLERE